MTAYIGLLRKEKNSDYGVDFPDRPECVSAGRTLDEARRMAADALSFHIEGMQADGQDIPPPSSLEAIMADRNRKGAVAVLLDAPDKPERAPMGTGATGPGAVRSVPTVPCLLMVAAPALEQTSSCEPVPPDTPMAPIILPPATSGMPPRDTMIPSSESTYTRPLRTPFSNALVSRR